jgi:hypothetical protein
MFKKITVRNGLLMLSVFSLVGAVLPMSAAAEQSRPVLTGKAAYAEPVAFDYNRDGKADMIQMWASFDVKPAVGKEGDTGYLPEEGTMRRYLQDIKTGQPVIGFSMFNMLPDTPIGEPVPVSDITLTGKTMSFNVGSMRYKVTDGGKGYQHDSITVNDGLNDYPVTLFDGDLTITGVQ